MNIWFTGDTHFSHGNIMKYCSETRPYDSKEEMNQKMVEDWNSTIAPDDVVYHVGDFAFAPIQKIIELKEQLNGKIHLIFGNHDRKIMSDQRVQDMFESCQHYLELKLKGKNFVLFHYPIEEWNKGHYGSIHIHGHCHGSLGESIIKRIDVGWDAFGGPVHIDDIIEIASTKMNAPHHGEEIKQIDSCLTLIRGPSGSGKTTIAHDLKGQKYRTEGDYYEVDIFEADDYFMKDGMYRFDGSKLKDAHADCFNRAKKSLLDNVHVIVSNTFTRRWEMKKYFNLARSLGVRLEIVDMNDGQVFDNSHGVPDDVVKNMQDRFENIDENFVNDNYKNGNPRADFVYKMINRKARMLLEVGDDDTWL